MRSAIRLFLVAITITTAFVPARTQQAPPPGSPFDALHFRDIGPAAAGGRLHDIQIDPSNPAVLYVAAATGGIWKSSNKGVTWKDMPVSGGGGGREGYAAGLRHPGGGARHARVPDAQQSAG